MKRDHTRLAWVLVLATTTGLLHTTSARAESESVYRHATGSSTVLWLSGSSEVPAPVRARHVGAAETAAHRSTRAVRGTLSPSDRETALYLACVGGTQLGRAESALRFCDEAVLLRGARDPRHLNNRANALLQAGRVAEAIADYRRAIALLKKDARRGKTAEGSANEPEGRASEVLAANLALALRRQAAEL